MFNRLIKRFTVGVCLLAVLAVCGNTVSAQVEKGSKEITVFSGGFFADLNRAETVSRIVVFDGTLETRVSSRSQGFDIGGRFGYFLTRKHEIGGGLNYTVSHSRICFSGSGDDEDQIEDCTSNTGTILGLAGFYRYNFAGKDERGFPFVGVGVEAANLTRENSRLARLRPEAGYKYFFNKNVALDASVGVSVDLNKINNFTGPITGVAAIESDRRWNLNGRIGLAFVF
jgi:hypothetical protein